MPGVTVTITSVERKTVDTAVTNASGFYVKDRLLPGTYEVKAELAGFKAAVVPKVLVSVDTQTPVDFSSSSGAVTEAVEVTGGRPLLKTDRADVATHFETKQITELPVLDRNFTKFILLTPGHAAAEWQHAASENPQGSTQTMVNGQHFSGTGYQLDGTENRDPILGHHRHQPEPRVDRRDQDHVAELRRGVRPGDRGRGVGADQVAAPNSSTAARSSSTRATSSRRATRSRSPDGSADRRFLPETKRNQFGGSIGGPIMQNKSFFFGDYQGTRSTEGGLEAADGADRRRARTGDLSAYGVNIFDPVRARDPTQRPQFAGNVIPTGPAVAAGARDPQR